jgi:hypothetical protein
LSTAAFAASAQDGPAGDIDVDGRKSTVLRVISEMNADIAELRRLVDYQNHILKLAETDPEGALRGRRPQENCAQRPLVLELCSILWPSFPPAAQTSEGRNQQQRGSLSQNAGERQ